MLQSMCYMLVLHKIKGIGKEPTILANINIPLLKYIDVNIVIKYVKKFTYFITIL